MPDDVKRTVVQLDVDQAASKRVQSETAAIKKRLEELHKEVRAAGREFGVTDKRLAKYGDEAQAVGRNIDKLQANIDNAEKAVKKLDRTMANADGADQYAASIKEASQRSELYGDTDSRLAAVGGFARTIGAGGAADALAGTSDFLGAVEGIQRMKAELPALAAQLGTSTMALGALGAGVVALTVVLDIFGRSVAATGEATRSFIDANQKYAEIIATGTTKEVNAAIQAEEGRQKALRIEREMLDEFLVQADNIGGLAGAFFDFNAALDGLNDNLGANYGGIEDVKDRLKEVDSQLSSSTSLETRLAQARDQGLLVTNDAVEAEQKLYEERLNKLNLEQQAVQRALTITEAQLDQSLEQLGQEFDYWWERSVSLDQKISGGDLSERTSQARDFAEAQLKRINADETAIEATRGLVQMYDQQRQAAADATKSGENYIRAFGDASRMTTAQVQSETDLNSIRLAGLELERAKLERIAQINPVAAATLEEINAQIDILTYRNSELSEVIKPAAEARDLEARMMMRVAETAGFLAKTGDDLADSLAQAEEEAQKYAETLAKRELQTAQTAAKRQLQLTQDAQQADLDRARDLADHYADLAELDADYYQDRGDIIRDAAADLADTEQERADEVKALNDDLQSLALDHAKNMRRIARDADRDELKAARNLDAVALADAKQSRKDAIEDEDEQYRDERDKREEQYQERLDLLDRERQETLDAQRQALSDLEVQHRQERAANEAAFAEEIRREDQNRQLKLSQQRQQWNLEDSQQRQQWALEDSQRQGAFNAQATQTATHMNNINTITSTGLSNVEAKFAGSFKRMAASVPSSSSSTTARIISAPRATRYAYAGGGYPPVDEDVTVGEYGKETVRFLSPVRVYPHGTTPPSRGRRGDMPPIQITIQEASTPSLTAREVNRQIDAKLAEYWN